MSESRSPVGSDPEEDREKRTFLLWMTTYFRAQLERTLAVLGIEVREHM
jgi:arginyl-tRNA synthetase